MSDTASVRKQLTDTFDDDELNALCFDYFRPVYEKFSTGMTRSAAGSRSRIPA